MEPSKPPHSVPGEFFLLMPDTTRGGKGHGVVFENAKRLRIPPRLILRPEEGGFPPMAEKPLLVYSAKKGSLPEDLEGGAERLLDGLRAITRRSSLCGPGWL
jgi:hypothetical protein